MSRSRRASWSFVVFVAALLTISHTATAQSVLSAAWDRADIGSPVLSGSSRQSGGVLTVDAAGSDIWGNSDQFYFVYQRVSGDGEIVARVAEVSAANAWSKAGVMIRASLDPGAPHGYALVSATRGVHFQRRQAGDGASASTAASSSGVAPAWVKAVRKGGKVTAYWSPDGGTWTLIGSSTIALGDSAYFGVAVTSHDGASRTSADLSDVMIASAALPQGQQSADIGRPAATGQSAYSNGVYTVQAGGTDIWGQADQFHYVYQSLSGDGELTARVVSIKRADAWSKAGLMIRESLTPESAHAMIVASASKGYAFQRRPDPAGLSASNAGSKGAPPGWVRLVRRGDLFEAYQSSNGTAWTRVGSDTIPMGLTVYAGLAVTSHHPSLSTTAVIDNFTVVPTSSATNQLPAVSVTSPAAGSQFMSPATVTVTANATDPEGRLSAVDFYADTTLIGRDTTAPYSVSWSAATAGSYSLTAVAMDADGGTTTSGAVRVMINQSGSTAPRQVTFTASADHAGNVTSYRFDVFASGANPSTATPIASANLGKPAPATNRDITSDQSTLFSNLAAGNYVATVTAIGPGGSTRSLQVAFTR